MTDQTQPNKPEGARLAIIEWLKKHGCANVTTEYAPKGRTRYKFSFDQGVCKGYHAYTIRYDQITPIWAAMVCEAEKFNNISEINDSIMQVLKKDAL